MTATLKELIDADLLAPGPIVFRYKGDCHAGTLLNDGNIMVGQYLFEKPGEWKSYLYGSIKLNGFHCLYTPLGTRIQSLRDQLEAQNQLPPEPPGDEDVHEDEAPVEAPQQRQQSSTGGRKRQQTRRLVNMADGGKTYVDRNDEEQPAPKKSRPAEDSSSSDDDADEAALRAQKKRASSQADGGKTYVDRNDEEQPAPKKSRPAEDSSSSEDDVDVAALRVQRKQRASSQAVQKPKTQFSVDVTPSVRCGRRHRREQTPCAPSTRRQLDRIGGTAE